MVREKRHVLSDRATVVVMFWARSVMSYIIWIGFFIIYFVIFKLTVPAYACIKMAMEPTKNNLEPQLSYLRWSGGISNIVREVRKFHL